MVTFAPTSTPPVSSVTLPEILPRFTCEKADALNRTTIKVAQNTGMAARRIYVRIRMWKFIAHPVNAEFSQRRTRVRISSRASLTHFCREHVYRHAEGQVHIEITRSSGLHP